MNLNQSTRKEQFNQTEWLIRLVREQEKTNKLLTTLNNNIVLIHKGKNNDATS